MPHYRANFIADLCVFTNYSKTNPFYKLQNRINYIKKSVEPN